MESGIRSVKGILIAAAMTLVLSGCANIKLLEAGVALTGKSIGVASALDASVKLSLMGVTPFGNESTTLQRPEWQLKERSEARVIERFKASGRYSSVRSVQTEPAPASESHRASAAIPRDQLEGLDFVLVLRPTWEPSAALGPEGLSPVEGLGIKQKNHLLRSNRAIAHAAMSAMLIDVKEGRTVGGWSAMRYHDLPVPVLKDGWTLNEREERLIRDMLYQQLDATVFALLVGLGLD